MMLNHVKFSMRLASIIIITLAGFFILAGTALFGLYTQSVASHLNSSNSGPGYSPIIFHPFTKVEEPVK